MMKNKDKPMLTDTWTIMQKEFKELRLQRPNLRGGWLGLLVLIGVFGIFLPLQIGPGWVSSPVNLALWAWVPFLLVSGVVADSFAGERERHTLETLLASRLSDRAILFGKIGAAMAYGWGLTLISLILGLITVNIAFSKGTLLLYPPGIGAGTVVLSFLVALFSAALGVLVSLRASSVRQAQQSFNAAMLALMIPLLAFPMLPESWREPVNRFLAGANWTAIVLVIFVLLIVLDLILVGAAMSRFKRARLILD